MKTQKDEDFDWEGQVGAKPLRLRPQNPRLAIWMGYLVSQIVGFGALAIVTLIFTNFNFNKLGDVGAWTGGILGFSQFFLIPFGMGFVASYFWLRDVKDLGVVVKVNKFYKRQSGEGSAFLNTLLSCFGAAFILREGVVCLLMASPILWMFMSFGVRTGAHFWRKNPFLSVSLAPIFLLLVFAEAGRPASEPFAVSTQFHSKASPAALWKYTASYPTNPHPGDWWLWRMGVPMPMSLDGKPVKGGRRDAILSGGVSAGSYVTHAEFARRLDFKFDQQPRHPEITHHFLLERGRIELIPDGQGGTFIKGTSWYRINVAPATYFNGWASAIVHQLHTRVFSWMDELARTDKTKSLAN
ncbi:MAG TPA: hypothetical protein VGB45_05670 [Abditibacterium sp.]|jgi:hypothetical protein